MTAKTVTETRHRGGRGKQDELRNLAVRLLYKFDKEKFNTYSMGKIFQRDPKTISDILGL